MPMSYDPIEIIPMTITRCCVASDAERKGEDKGAKKGVSIDESDDGAGKEDERPHDRPSKHYQIWAVSHEHSNQQCNGTA